VKEFYDRAPVWSSISQSLQKGWEQVQLLDVVMIRFRIYSHEVTIDKGKLVESQGRKVTDLSYQQDSFDKSIV
jgi:hypothetical protein